MGRDGWALCALAGTSVTMLAPDADEAWHDLTGPGFPGALMALGCLAQLVLSLWVLGAVALVVLRAPGPLVRAVAPRVLRQALLAGTAGALVLSPASADPAAAPHGADSPHDLVGLRLPDRPDAAVSEPSDQSREPVTVRSGDTLWAIAAHSLPRTAGNAEVAAASARWYAANRGVVGDDPNLIFPGQQLMPPLGKDPT